MDALIANSNKRDSPQTDDDPLRFQDRATVAGLTDRSASGRRDQDFVGLFTPPYLHALEDKESRQLERTSSAPTEPPSGDIRKGLGGIERANSDSMAQAKPKRPSHLELPHRTSSSGSSAEGKLTSAMRSPTQRPKQKRVSLAVGDEIVAPSDSVPAVLSNNSIPSHSRVRSPLPEHPTSAKRGDIVKETENKSIDSALQIAETIAVANAMPDEAPILSALPPAALEAPSEDNFATMSRRPKVDADGDLFDLENESDASDVDTDDLDKVLESDEEVMGPVDTYDAISGSLTEPTEVRYDSTTGLIPEPTDGEDSAVPYLGSGPGSAVASQQPMNPGFRRPSVIQDPIFRGANYTAAERNAVENDVYGSSYNRPASKGSFTAGSLGQSFMDQFAEERMRERGTRKASQETKVKS